MAIPGEIPDPQPDFEQWDAFWQDGQRVGALRRVWKYSVLLTRVAIESDAGTYLAESRIRFVPGTDWDLSWFHTTGMDEPVLLHNPASWTHTGSLPLVDAAAIRARDGRELPPGLTLHVPAGTLPGYGEFLVLRHLVSAGRREASWTAVDDDDGHPLQTRLVAVEDPDPPAYVVHPAGPGADGAILRYDRFDDAQRVASHWVADGTILASEWAGAHSVPVRDQAGSAGWEAIAGLEPASADFLLHGTRR